MKLLVVVAVACAMGVIAYTAKMAAAPALGLQFPSGIPLHLWNPTGMSLMRKGFQHGDVKAQTASRQVHLLWTARADANGAPDWTADPIHLEELNPIALAFQRFATRYYPIAISVVGDSEILIAGIEDGGSTVIERWGFTWPTPMPAPFVDQTTGVSTVSVVTPDQTSVDVLFSTQVSGMRHVTDFCVLFDGNGPTRNALVFFDDSRDLFVLNMDTGAISLLASSSSSMAPLGVIPELASLPIGQIWPADKAGAGFVYVFTRRAEWTGVQVPAGAALAFIDGDRDGHVDAHVVITEKFWEGLDWTNAASYVDSWRW